MNAKIVVIGAENTKSSLREFYKSSVLDSTKIIKDAKNNWIKPKEFYDDNSLCYSQRSAELSNNVWLTFSTEKKTYARNPRAMVIRSKYVFDLLSNKSQNSIILKFNESYHLK